MTKIDPEEIHAVITVSAARRIMAYGIQLALGAILVYAAFAGGAGPIAAAILLIFGGLVLWGAERIRRTGNIEIYLTDQGVFDSTGVQLAAFNDIASVSRGPFALKPSNGFGLNLKTKQSRAWVPGLWWRFGQKVGVGGITSAGAAKFMAEQITLRLAFPEGETPTL